MTPLTLPAEFLFGGFTSIFRGLVLFLAAVNAAALIAILVLCYRELSGGSVGGSKTG